MRLLRQVLGEQLAGGINGFVVVVIHRANDELRAVYVFERASCFACAFLQQLHGFIVVLRWDAIVEQHAIANLARHLHHLVAGGADHDGHMARLAPPVNDIQLDLIDVMEFAVESDALHVEQAAQNDDGLAHGSQRLAALDAHVARQRIPPGADAADDAVGSQVIQRQEGGRQQPDVARPVVDDARANLEALGYRGVSSHGHNRIAHQPRLCLPDGFEAAHLRRSARSPIHRAGRARPVNIGQLAQPSHPPYLFELVIASKSTALRALHSCRNTSLRSGVLGR